MDAQRTALKAKETSLLEKRRVLKKRIMGHCDQLLLKAEYRAMDDLVELDTPTISDVAQALLRDHAELLGVNSRLARIDDGLY